MSFISRPHFVTCDCLSAASPVEMFNPEPRKSSLILANENVDFTRFVNDLTAKNNFWLPAAAEKLNISSQLRDYVIVPTVSMPSDLPNRNGMAFPFEELSGWVPDHGRPMYETWIGKPTFVEHNNSDHTQAKGIILDCRMSKMKGVAGDIWKVLKLLAFDRTRDPILASDILSGRRTCYSMGANASDFRCSVCSSLNSQGGCEHVNPPSVTFRNFKEFNGVLAFNNVLNPVGFETSSVVTPAFLSASNTKPLNWLTI